ncbi:MAG: hypothetical protein R3E12_00415 [Candidatus Eisenbacteria bacterium]|uniref:Uncharacterized protein n=1 Tax=Eiseniibacteriota bacterium TaxID=2212470 RepID=A0A956M1V4_UNCEI|nr:hypothetical protein [Candidatus Eisenbacteria bacterium]
MRDQTNPQSKTLTAGEVCRRLTILAEWVENVRQTACGLPPDHQETLLDPFMVAVMKAMEETSLSGSTNPPWRGGACPPPAGDV